MKIKFSGDFAILAKWTDQIARAPKVLDTLNEQLAEETVELIREGFDSSTDPYGDKWEPLVLRSGRPLEDTGGLKASWHRRNVSRTGFTVGSSKQTARWHQRGTGVHGPRKRRIRPRTASALSFSAGGQRYAFRSVRGSPKRMMVPTGGNLPARWRARYVRTAQDVLTELFR